jgi:hypothetical protein
MPDVFDQVAPDPPSFEFECLIADLALASAISPQQLRVILQNHEREAVRNIKRDETGAIDFSDENMLWFLAQVDAWANALYECDGNLGLPQ